MNAFVRILKSNNQYDINYTYIVPDSLSSRIDVGVFVTVPFGTGNRTENAIVTGIAPDDAAETSPYRLKEIAAVRDDWEKLSPEMMRLADRIGERYVSGPAESLRLLTTPSKKAVEKVAYVTLTVSGEEAESILSGSRIRNIRQIRIIRALLAEPDGRLRKAELLTETEGKPADLTALKKLGMVDWQNVREPYVPTPEEGILRTVPQTVAPELNREQSGALEKLKSLLFSGEFHEFLLHGVTGSGKTEVYLGLISAAMERGIGAILLVPEIVLTEQMIDRVIGRFGRNVAVIHSRLTPKEALLQQERIRSGTVRVVVGVRSAVFSEVKNLGLVIVDEEQEPSYKSFDLKPYYHAAEVAAMRMKDRKGLVVYGSATPRVSTFYRAEQGEIGYAALRYRATLAALPEVISVDMKKERENGNRSPISLRLREELNRNLERGEQSIIFLPRRGYSARMACFSCGKTVICRHCHVPMAYHKSIKRLVCHYCGSTEIVPSVCPGCGSSAVTFRTFGTEMAEEELGRLFPGIPAVRMDTDSTGVKDGHRKLLERFEKDHVPFLVGTQMVAKGLDFPNVTLVGVVNADSLLNVEAYNTAERAFVLLCQVFGRAGRTAEKPGRCILQTLNPEESVFRNAADQDYDAFYRREIQFRRTLGYPPFTGLCTVTVSGEDDRRTFDGITEIHRNFAEILPKDKGEICGVTRAPLPVLNDRFRWTFLVKSEDKEALLSAARKLNRDVLSPPERKERRNLLKEYNITVSLDVDFG